MKRITVVYIILNLIFLTFVIAQQQQYPNLWNVQIHACISYNKSEKIFYYAYSILNNATNIGIVDKIEVDISRKIGTIDIDTIGLQFKNDGFTEGSFRRHFPSLKGKIIPVGFTKKPWKWTAGLTNNLTAAFFTTRTYSINLGQSLDGFEAMSKGLPSIRQCIVSPFFDIIALFPSPDTIVSYYVPPVDSVRNAVKFHGWTIGPTSPPNPFVQLNFLDTLSSYTTQSRSLGWIKDQPTANKYLAYFATAKDSLQNNKVDTARGILRQVLKEVDIDSTGNITSEAYALLRYNTEYLLEHLLDQYVVLSLSRSWSMVSVPLLQSNYDADVVFPGKYGVMFGCNTVIQDYEVAGTLACGLGYWVYYIDPTTITISGLIPDTVSVTSAGGWVMVGSRHTPVQISSLVFSDGAERYGSAFRYDQVIGDYVSTEVINPGESVWIYVTKACTITIP